MFVTKGFKGNRNNESIKKRTPPGQRVTDDFPVLTAGPTQQIALEDWKFSISGLVEKSKKWSYQELSNLGFQNFTCDIHCVTRWSKLGTTWEGIGMKRLLEQMVIDKAANFALITSYGGYTTNLPLKDLWEDNVFIGLKFNGEPLTPEHGGPARLVVPQVYFWKSAKWIKNIELISENKLGFWEKAGYHEYGDPWLEQRFRGD